MLKNFIGYEIAKQSQLQHPRTRRTISRKRRWTASINHVGGPKRHNIPQERTRNLRNYDNRDNLVRNYCPIKIEKLGQVWLFRAPRQKQTEKTENDSGTHQRLNATFWSDTAEHQTGRLFVLKLYRQSVLDTKKRKKEFDKVCNYLDTTLTCEYHGRHKRISNYNSFVLTDRIDTTDSKTTIFRNLRRYPREQETNQDNFVVILN